MTSYITIRRHAEAGRTLPSTQYNEIDYLRIRKLLKMDGDIDIGANKIKTENFVIVDDGQLRFYRSDMAVEYLRVDKTLPGIIAYAYRAQSGTHFIMTYPSATAYIALQSHDGSAYVTNLKLQGGYVEIYRGKLTSDLLCQEYGLENVNYVRGRSYTEPLDLVSMVNAANAGEGIRLRTNNASDVIVDRLVFFAGYDIADILIRNAQLKPDMANGGAIGIEFYVDDFGGNFANFTPPEGFEGRIIVAIDTNSTNPGQRLYVYANGKWNYVDLTVA